MSGQSRNCPYNPKTVLKNLGFTRICREIVNVAIYALYPESFCGKDLAVRKVFAFSDSAKPLELDWIRRVHYLVG